MTTSTNRELWLKALEIARQKWREASVDVDNTHYLGHLSAKAAEARQQFGIAVAHYTEVEDAMMRGEDYLIWKLSHE